MRKVTRAQLRRLIREALSKEEKKMMFLGFSHKSWEKELKKAYRKLAMKHHPDRNPKEKKAEADENFKEASAIYGVLAKIRAASSVKLGLDTLDKSEEAIFLNTFDKSAANVYKKAGTSPRYHRRTGEKPAKKQGKSTTAPQKPAGPVSLFEDIANIIRTKKPDLDTDSKTLAKMLSEIVKIGNEYTKKDKKAAKEKTSSYDQEYFNRVISCLIAILTMRVIVEKFESTIYKEDNKARRQAGFASKIVNTFLKQMGSVGQGSAYGYEIDKNVFSAMLTNAGPVFGMSDDFREYNETIKSALNNSYWTRGPQNLAPRVTLNNGAYVNLDINTFRDLAVKIASEVRRIKKDPKNKENTFIQALNVKA